MDLLFKLVLITLGSPKTVAASASIDGFWQYRVFEKIAANSSFTGLRSQLALIEVFDSHLRDPLMVKPEYTLTCCQTGGYAMLDLALQG
jgi:hypothetical protein